MINKIILLSFKFIRKIQDDDIFSLSAQFAYYIILGIFPFIFVMVSILGHYSIVFYNALKSAQHLIPFDIYNFIVRIADDSFVFFNSSYISISVLTLIWSASSGSVGIIKGINKAYDCPIKKNYIFMRIKGIFFTFALMFSLQFAFLFIVVGSHMIDLIKAIVPLPTFVVVLFNILRFLLPILLLILICSFTYKFLPYEKVSFRSIIPGAVFSTFSWIIGSFFYSIYIAQRSSFYNNIYGNLSGIFIVIVWIYISSFIFLLGAELNAFVKKNLYTHLPKQHINQNIQPKKE